MPSVEIISHESASVRLGMASTDLLQRDRPHHQPAARLSVATPHPVAEARTRGPLYG